jgi:uncharacterized protein
MPASSESSHPPDLEFQEHLGRGEIRLQHCDECNRFFFFPRTMCPHCGSDKSSWQRISGKGTVYSTTTVRQRPDRGGDYNIALIDLAENVRMMSRIEGIPPQNVKIGMAVVADISDVGETKAIIFLPELSA